MFGGAKTSGESDSWQSSRHAAASEIKVCELVSGAEPLVAVRTYPLLVLQQLLRLVLIQLLGAVSRGAQWSNRHIQVELVLMQQRGRK